MTATFHVSQLDAIEGLRSIPDETIDLIVTDCAYESLEKHRAKGTTTRLKKSKASSNEWFPIFPNARFPELFAEFYRVLVKDAHLYFYCDQETMFVAKPIAEAAGFKLRKALVWDKVTIGMGYSYRARHEMILYFEKGKRKLNDLGVADIITCPRVRNGRPTEKPVAVSEVLIRQSSREGEVVLDPFCGSGAIGVAALKLGRRFVGFDIDEDAVAHSDVRLRGLLARSDVLSKELCELDWSVRTANFFMNNNLNTVGQLCELSTSDLLRTKNVGRVTLSEVKEVLAELGLWLRA